MLAGIKVEKLIPISTLNFNTNIAFCQASVQKIKTTADAVVFSNDRLHFAKTGTFLERNPLKDNAHCPLNFWQNIHRQGL